MNPLIETVEPLEAGRLRLRFVGGDERIFDASPYFSRGMFVELADFSYFQRVVACPRHVSWPHGQDFSHDTLYLRSVSASSLRAA